MQWYLQGCSIMLVTSCTPVAVGLLLVMMWSDSCCLCPAVLCGCQPAKLH